MQQTQGGNEMQAASCSSLIPVSRHNAQRMLQHSDGGFSGHEGIPGRDVCAEDAQRSFVQLRVTGQPQHSLRYWEHVAEGAHLQGVGLATGSLGQRICMKGFRVREGGGGLEPAADAC